MRPDVLVFSGIAAVLAAALTATLILTHKEQP